mgnify:CR=1 FL=1
MISPTRDRDEGKRRILLALDYVRDQANLEIAVLLAKSMSANLEAIFIEDDQLRRIAQLPFACEIGFGSAVVRRMELTRLDRDLKNRAMELQRSLRRHATNNRVKWSFSVIRGALPAAALAVVPEADMYILPCLSSGYPEQQHRTTGPIAILLDGSPESLHALEAAAALSNDLPLRVLVPAQDGETLWDRAMPLLQRQKHAALFIPIDDLSPESIAANIRKLRISLLILGYTEQFRDPDVLESLQTATGTRLILAN